MNIVLLNPLDNKYTPLEQFLYNRGVTEIDKYLNNKDEDINEPEAFGEELLHAAAVLLIQTIANNGKIKIIVDPDVDGFSASALIINYLYEIFPSFVLNNVTWILHEGKGHGIDEFIDELERENFDLLICPDCASNDLDSIDRLYNQNKSVLILDHHIADKLSDKAITINSQYNYPNPYLSGVGVVYQFCKYLDKITNKDIVDNFLDLVATGLQSDMMDLRNLEIKELIFKGFQENKINNPLIYGLKEKNSYSLNKEKYLPSYENGLEITPIGCSFFITPLINAICRTGTIEEKKIVFESMLSFKAFEQILSTKRGHSLNEKETRVEQALRVCTNVKNRQTKIQDKAIIELEKRIKEDDMLKHKMLLFLLDEDTEITPEVRGLIANKFAPKYQRPCAVLTYCPALPWDDKDKIDMYTGSMRGYEGSGLKDFRSILLECKDVIYVEGHENAAGLAINAEKIDEFLDEIDSKLDMIGQDIIYPVDYIFDGTEANMESIILNLSKTNDYIGKNIERPTIAIKNLKITKDMLTFMASDTLKISLPNGVNMIKFNSPQDNCDLYSENGYVKINLVGKPSKNEWNGFINGQILIDEYEIIDNKGWDF